MKRLSCVILLLALLFWSTACGQPAAEDDRLNVVTTIFPQYDFVRQIAGDAVQLTMLLPLGGESHSYEPTPRDIAAVAACDLFIEVGGPSESWAAELRQSSDTDGMQVIALLDLVEVIGGKDEHDHDHEEHDDELDEHVWTSPKNAAVIVSAIADALIGLDPDNAALYRANADTYLAELGALDAEFGEIVANNARKTVIFGDRFPFRYLADAYGLSYAAAFPGCAAESEPAPATVAALIEQVKAEAIPVVFTIEFSRGEVADAICEATGAQKRMMHSCHNLSVEDFNAGVTYLQLMRQNAEVLKQALS